MKFSFKIHLTWMEVFCTIFTDETQVSSCAFVICAIVKRRTKNEEDPCSGSVSGYGRRSGVLRRRQLQARCEQRCRQQRSCRFRRQITLWTYPIGNWGKEDVVKELTDAFTAETGIKVSVEYLDYTNGDDKVNSAITAKNAPDVIMEGPERLVANWGANGYMVDL